LRVIPLWLRLLAGLLAVASGIAILLLLRETALEPPAGAGLVAAAARALLFLALAVLFGYTALTGLPPTHWWRDADEHLWPAAPAPALTPDAHRYLARLRQRHAGIRECWLLDPVAPGEWRLLAMAPPEVAAALRGDWDIRRRDLRLYLLVAGTGTVELAWGRSVPASFTTWDWEPQDDQVAEFRCPERREVRRALRLWTA